MSAIVKIAKKAKQILKKGGLMHERPYMSLTRRIERVKTAEKVCAMTFDDGPCALPPIPWENESESLTGVILDIMKRFDARGTFDVVGDTGANYPDDIGLDGTASWGGIKYDHYPQYECDEKGGAFSQPQLIARILEEGHEISNHSYRHILFGKKRFVYGKRRSFTSLGDVLDDLSRLHRLMLERHGYKMTLARPPHYVDTIKGGFDSYDAYSLMRYQYMAASFDGAGWLPLSGGYEDEVRAMVSPLKKALEADDNALCGQIIFEKDGYNMQSRSPVADGLSRQLELLRAHGYKVVTVSELLKLSPFADIGEGDACFAKAKLLLERDHCIAYRDNTVRPDKTITRGEAAMLAAPRQAILERLLKLEKNPDLKSEFSDLPVRHPYSSAVKWCVEKGLLDIKAGRFNTNHPLSRDDFDNMISLFRGRISAASGPVTRGEFITALCDALYSDTN